MVKKIIFSCISQKYLRAFLFLGDLVRCNLVTDPHIHMFHSNTRGYIPYKDCLDPGPLTVVRNDLITFTVEVNQFWMVEVCGIDLSRIFNYGNYLFGSYCSLFEFNRIFQRSARFHHTIGYYQSILIVNQAVSILPFIDELQLSCTESWSRCFRIHRRLWILVAFVGCLSFSECFHHRFSWCELPKRIFFYSKHSLND